MTMHRGVRHLQANNMFINAVKQVLEMIIERKNEKLKMEIYTFLFEFSLI